MQKYNKPFRVSSIDRQGFATVKSANMMLKILTPDPVNQAMTSVIRIDLEGLIATSQAF